MGALLTFSLLERREEDEEEGEEEGRKQKFRKRAE